MTAPTHRIGDEELLGRLSRARDLPEALSTLFASVLEPEGVERALVLVEDRRELRAKLAQLEERLDRLGSGIDRGPKGPPSA